MARIVAVMDTMWGGQGKRAPRFFRINPYNFSGKRLYRIVGRNNHLLVTESCKESVSNAKQHGRPDPEWLAGNLKYLEPISVILLCGRVAQKTFKESGYKSKALIVEMMHPAARGWTKEMEREFTKKIKGEKQ